ncbi:hypothetical protein PG997_002506 [Apiospora hydei]|uniref:Uncharacterized protein n=1 Tax=Apiospora hydei TaxID=1337664 RepID=A0ABR1WWL2_9PEZI
MTHSERQPIGFLFINTAHPSEASTPKSLSQIRSHAAKENRARQAARTQAHPAAIERTKSQLRRRRQPISDPTGSSRLRAQEPAEEAKTGHAALAPEAVPVPSFPTKDPHWNPVRPLSARETLLLDHYINHVILFNRGRCREGGGSSSPPWFTSMQLKCWLPFALADHGLLASLLLQSCRSLESSIGRPGSYTDTYMVYKQKCIQWVNECVSSEHRRASDATISMVTVLLTESYILGNLDEWNVHLGAHTRMLELRGGVDALGFDGFLKVVIEKSPWLFKRPSVLVN